jgi:hypothetical protein
MSDFAKELLKTYCKSPSQIAFENLQKIDSKLNPNNIFALAYMASNEALDDKERSIFKECLKIKLDEQYRTPVLPNEKITEVNVESPTSTDEEEQK